MFPRKIFVFLRHNLFSLHSFLGRILEKFGLLRLQDMA